MRALILAIIAYLVLAYPAHAGGWGIEVDAATAEHLCSGDRAKWCGTDMALAQAAKTCNGSPHPYSLPWAGKTALCADIKDWWRAREPYAVWPKRSGRPLVLAQSSGHRGPITPDVARWMYDNDPERKRERAAAEQRERDRKGK